MDNKNNSALPPQDFAPLYKLAIVILVIGVLLSCFAFVKVDGPILKFILISLGSALTFLGILLLFAIGSAKKFASRKHNYFLYDKKTRKEIELDALTFSLIREKVQKYMSLFKRGKKLYVGDLFNNDIKVPHAIRTLFCYELLYEISEGGFGVQKANRFLSFGQECAGVFYAYLTAAGEIQLAEKLRIYFNGHLSGEDTSEKLHRFLDANKSYLEAAIVKYTKDHINEF